LTSARCSGPEVAENFTDLRKMDQSQDDTFKILRLLLDSWETEALRYFAEWFRSDMCNVRKKPYNCLEAEAACTPNPSNPGCMTISSDRT